MLGPRKPTSMPWGTASAVMPEMLSLTTPTRSIASISISGSSRRVRWNLAASPSKRTSRPASWARNGRDGVWSRFGASASRSTGSRPASERSDPSIMSKQALRAILGLGLRRDLDERHHDGAPCALAPDGREDDADGPVLDDRSHGPGRRAGVVVEPRQEHLEVGEAGPREQREDLRPDQRRPPNAEQLLGPAVGVGHPPAGVELDDARRRALEHRAQVPLDPEQLDDLAPLVDARLGDDLLARPGAAAEPVEHVEQEAARLREGPLGEDAVRFDRVHRRGALQQDSGEEHDRGGGQV